MRADLGDAIGVLGLALVGAGVGMKDVASALVVVGAVLLAVSLVGAWRGTAATPHDDERRERRTTAVTIARRGGESS